MAKSKIALVLLLTILLILGLTACFGAGVGDWTYSDLPGRYELWRINSRCIRLCLPDEERPFLAKTIVDGYVFELAYDDAFICAKRADVPEDIHQKIDLSDPDYFIVDVNEEKCYGPFDEQTFYKSCQELGVSEGLNWLDLWTLRHND